MLDRISEVKLRKDQSVAFAFRHLGGGNQRQTGCNTHLRRRVVFDPICQVLADFGSESGIALFQFLHHHGSHQRVDLFDRLLVLLETGLLNAVRSPALRAFSLASFGRNAKKMFAMHQRLMCFFRSFRASTICRLKSAIP